MSNGTNQSKASTPEPVSSTGQLDSESSGKFEGNDVTNTSNEAETSKDTITKEWLEGILANMLNPNNVTKDKLMDIMKNVLDEKKFAQVKSIMDSDDEKAEEKDEPSKEDKNETVSEKADPVVETEASDSTAPKPKPRKKPTKKKTSELDKLNEDIRTMFISEGVLTATGRRMCTELRKKTVCYTETSPPTSPKGNDNEAQAEADPPQPVPGPSKKGRKRKATDTAQEPNQKEDASVSDIAKKLNINRMLKVELKKLKDSEIPQNAPVKKGKKKAQKAENDASSVSDSPTPPKKKIRRRNSIWFRNPPKKKGKNTRTASSGNETDSVFETTEPPPPKKRPGPKSKTQIQQPAEIKSKPAPMDIDVSAIKKEPSKQSFAIKNTDPSITALNHKSCKICTYSGKQIVTHYVKDHPLNEVFCSRLPRNISDFLRKNEKGMLYAESYNMKLNYAGSKIFGHCIFCREEMYEQPNRWITHFTKHTGEFEYICSCNFKTWSQKVMRAHVKKCEERGSYVFNEIVLNNEQLIKAFMCGDCNYLQLLEENVRNHIITEHTTCPKVHKVILLNFCDETVKKNHQTFLEMYKHNMTSGDETQEGGVFKSTDEKENEPTTSKSIFDDISKSIPNESGSGIANKLHERFGEMGKESVVIKTEDTASEELLLSDMTQTEDTTSIPDMGDAPMPNAENPIEYDDDEWEDIESDSDESVMSQSGRPGRSKKLARLAQKIGAKGNVKRKSEPMVEDKSPKKTKTDLPSTAVSNEDQSHPTVICKTESTATEFYKVENFQYQIVNDETQYHCLMPKCMFISSAVELFIDHLIKVHDDDTWSGYCDLCKEDKFPVSRSMITEFHHLVNDHPWKKPTDAPEAPAQPQLLTPTVPAPMVTEIKEEVKPTIRLRRLSGDKLSVQSDDSFKIPTTPTTLRSVTIRRVSQSPDLSRSTSPISGSPPTNLSNLSSFSSPNFNAQSPLSRSILIKRTNSIDTPNTSSTSTAQIHTVPASLSSFSMTSPIRSPTFSISTAKPTSSIVTVTSNANAVSVPAKISLRRSTISTDILPGVISRVDMMNELKPWIKQPCCKVPHAIMRMLQREVLYAPFKCMGTECWFFTTNEVEMAEHLRCHDQISEEQSERATITDTSSWLECAYCDYMAGSRNDLMMHLKKEHLYCEYICPKCFFRACNANYVARHLQVYHKTNISVLHIKSDYVNNTISNPVTCVKENVQLLLCKTCNLKFLNYVHFEQHINNHASHSFDCGFCSSLIPNDYMKKHMFCHLIGNFECIYCEFATNNRNSLAQHMCDKHPNRPLLYYNREEPQEQVDKFKLSTFDDFCQFRVTTEFIARESLPKTSNKAPVCIPVVKHTSSVAPTLPTPSTSSTVAANQESMPLVILNVVSLNEKSQPKTPPTSSLAIKDVCTLSRDNPGTPLTITSVSGSSSLDQHSVKAPETTPSTPSLVLEAVTVSKEEFEKQSFDFSTSLSRAIADWVSKTGVPQTELLKCSEMECDFQGKFKGTSWSTLIDPTRMLYSNALNASMSSGMLRVLCGVISKRTGRNAISASCVTTRERLSRKWWSIAQRLFTNGLGTVWYRLQMLSPVELTWSVPGIPVRKRLSNLRRIL
uniref:C2H2-type domain-containing protein n=1 Tax=Lutzomyia longipalpis TaxID=7200 RepID=A0A1B0CSA8_LUTLO